MDILQDGIEGWVARDKDDKDINTKGQLHFFWENLSDLACTGELLVFAE